MFVNLAKFKTVKRSNTYNALMEVLKIHCEDCEQELPISSLQMHIKICPEKLIECDNEGCEIEVKRKDMEGHSRDCGFAVARCQYCGEEMLRKEIEKH